MENIVIYGDSVFAERIYSCMKFENAANIIAFTNARTFITKDSIDGIKVIPFEDLRIELPNIDFSLIIAIGYNTMNNLRKKIYNECVEKGYKISCYISKNALLYSENIGEGTIIMPNCYIGPNVTIGICNIIQACVCISHHNKIGNFNYISPRVTFGGHARLENNIFVGLNSTIKNSVIISDYSLIGAGSNVLKSTEPYSVNIGNPARQLIGKNSLDSKI